MTGNQGQDRWYAAKTKAGQDRLAVERLQRQNFETYYPTIVVERFRNGRISHAPESLFPGYVLIKFCLDVCAWRSINSTRGVLRLISFHAEGIPSALPIGEIERLQEREKQGKLYVSEIIRFRRGDKVRMKIGTAVDQIGEVVRTRGERVEFLLNLLGRKVQCIAPQHALHLVCRANRPTLRKLSPSQQ
jgi:transcriptional antiterminator RfaH